MLVFRQPPHQQVSSRLSSCLWIHSRRSTWERGAHLFTLDSVRPGKHAQTKRSFLVSLLPRANLEEAEEAEQILAAEHARTRAHVCKYTAAPKQTALTASHATQLLLPADTKELHRTVNYNSRRG